MFIKNATRRSLDVISHHSSRMMVTRISHAVSTLKKLPPSPPVASTSTLRMRLSNVFKPRIHLKYLFTNTIESSFSVPSHPVMFRVQVRIRPQCAPQRRVSQQSKFIDHPPGASSCKKSTSTTTAPVTPASTSVYFGGTPTSISGDAASSICTPPSLKPPLLQKSLSESRLLFSQSRGVFSRPSMFTSPPPESERDTSSSGTSESSSSVEIAEEMHSGAAVGSGGGDKAVGRLHTLKLH